MAYIREKVKKGNLYYYVVEGRRVDGKVKQVTLEYIGPMDKLKQLALTGYLSQKAVDTAPDLPGSQTQGTDADDYAAYANLSVKTYAHGAVAALLWTAEQLELDKILDASFASQTSKGLSKSKVLLLHMIHQAVDPGNKQEFADWSRETSLPNMFRLEADTLSSAVCWETINHISEEEITEAWGRIIRKWTELSGADEIPFRQDNSNHTTEWTEQKTREHVFLCQSANMMTEAMRIHFAYHGIVLSKEALLERLNEIREGWIYVGEKNVKHALERLDQPHQELWNVAETIKDGLQLKKTE
ncbi:MAG: hypothetical protein IJ708_03055 [Clostridia bacterium]|nr:hypothetical protein [Clostridia bacterium]